MFTHTITYYVLIVIRHAAVPQSYPASIGSGRGNLKCQALKEGGRYIAGVLVGLYSCWEDSIGIC
jgi:hypothetical protein